MSVLSPPRDERVQLALDTTRIICRGEVIDGSTALRHAVGVVLTLEEFVKPVDPDLAAGIILHDTPYSAPDQTELDALLESRFGPDTQRVVRTIEKEHAYMGRAPGLNDDLKHHIGELLLDEPVLLATAADKITAFRAILKRAAGAPDEVEFWRRRTAFRERMPYFLAFQQSIANGIPEAMSAELEYLVGTANARTHA